MTPTPTPPPSATKQAEPQPQSQSQSPPSRTTSQNGPDTDTNPIATPTRRLNRILTSRLLLHHPSIGTQISSTSSCNIPPPSSAAIAAACSTNTPNVLQTTNVFINSLPPHFKAEQLYALACNSTLLSHFYSLIVQSPI
ncbi:hypothetical protein M422DRAFT_271536, partial [Sphaerobolus stellatus SS14]